MKQNIYKVGYSIDPYDAADDMNRGHHDELFPFYCFKIDFVNAQFIENIIHDFLDYCIVHDKHEFFNIKYTILKKIILYTIW